MKLILRKNDSATSLLLFIYNLYLVKYSQESLKLSSLLEILKVFNKQESAIRMSLSRAVKAGILSNSRHGSEVIYSLTSMGRHSIDLWNEGVDSFWKRYRLRQLPWEGKWDVLNIDFQEVQPQRLEVIDKLHQLGFATINTNTWLCPYHQPTAIKALTKKFGLDNGIVEIYGELVVHKEMSIFIEEVYSLKALVPQYQQFINKYQAKLEQAKGLEAKNKLIAGEQALPLLHEFGWEFFAIAANDPVLPKQLHPGWEGDEAASMMRDSRARLLQAVWDYLEGGISK